MSADARQRRAAAPASPRLRVAFVEDNEELRSLALEVMSESGMDVYIAERDTVEIDDLARYAPDVFVVDPCGAAGASRPPFAVSLAIRRDTRLGAVPLVLLTDEWTLEVHAAEAEAVDADATVLMPFGLEEFVASVKHAAMAGRTHGATRTHEAEESGHG